MALPVPDEFKVETAQAVKPTDSLLVYVPYLLAGAFFGIVAIRSEIASW